MLQLCERMLNFLERIGKPFEWLIDCFEWLSLSVQTDNGRKTDACPLEKDKP